MIFMKIRIHNIFIIYKIVYKFGADTSSRFREITIWKEGEQKFNLIFVEICGPIVLSKELGYQKFTSKTVSKQLTQFFKSHIFFLVFNVSLKI